MSAYFTALAQARREHQTKIFQVPGRWAAPAANWSCSCGKGSPSRLDPPTYAQARSYAERHIEAEAKKIVKRQTEAQDVVLCGPCAAQEPSARPTDRYSVDGCDRCENGGAGHQVYEVQV